MIYFISVVLAAAVVLMVQARIYRKHSFDRLEYTVALSSDEIFEGEEIYLYEEIANRKFLPLPFLKVDTELPEGLAFIITEPDSKTGELRETYPRVIHSVFVLRGNQLVRRRWRVICRTRGTYHLGSATLTSDDILGTGQTSKVLHPEDLTDKAHSTVAVLPRAVDLRREFTKSRYTNGEFIVASSLLSDPLTRAGVREYQAGDPLNRINWLQTAVRGGLMVNIEEFTNRHQFNIIMNMQSRDMEKTIPGPPSYRKPVEMCLTVAASILDKVSSENIAVRIISNTPPENIYGDDGADAKTDEEKAEETIDDRLFVSQAFQGKNDMLLALRILAQLELEISVPIEKMLDRIVESPSSFTSGGNIVFISAYLSERMINFAYTLRQAGVGCVFYITSAGQNAAIIPDDIEVHFRMFTEQ